MSLTNSQYSLIERRYEERRLKNQKLQASHRDYAYRLIPRLAEIDAEIATVSVKKARVLLHGGEDFDLEREISLRQEERRTLLSMHGLPENYLDTSYDCPVCMDTGYVNGKKCSCFLNMEVSLLYHRSGMKDALKEENFETFCEEYYPDDLFEQAGGFSSRENAVIARNLSKEFVNTFDTEFHNLCYYGDTGVGKTFLSHCIAKELLDTGHSVLYLTAFDLFDNLAKRHFSTEEELKNSNHPIFNSDLLIIDDLGTELTNSFVSSALFLCINERILSKRSTVISTNLSLKQFADVYSERTFSRILSHYKMIRLFGNDIRVRKRLSGGTY